MRLRVAVSVGTTPLAADARFAALALPIATLWRTGLRSRAARSAMALCVVAPPDGRAPLHR